MMKNEFEFASVTANNGKLYRYESKKMFVAQEDEERIREMVKQVFAGEEVRIPGYNVSVIGRTDGMLFEFKFIPKDINLPSINQWMRKGLDHVGVLYVHGTIQKGLTTPIDASKRLLKTYSQLSSLKVPSISEKSAAKTPYAVDTLNYLLMPFCDFSFFATGMSGEYSKAMACVAMDILMSKEV